MKIETDVTVETPESVWLTFTPAGVWVRFRAYVLDVLVRGVVAGAFLFVLALLTHIALGDVGNGMLLVLLFAFEWLYAWFFEAFMNGQTPGKRMTGIRVISTNGAPISFQAAMLRNLLRGADVLPTAYAVGLVTALSTRRFQRLGDLAAATMVIHERRVRLRRSTGKSDIEPIAADERTTRYRPDDRLLALLERLYERRGAIPRARANEIAAPIAGEIALRMGYEGDVDQAPAAFLCRVFRTFADRGATE